MPTSSIKPTGPDLSALLEGLIETDIKFILVGGLAKSIPWNEWASLEDYLNFLAHRGCSLNVIPLVGQGTIRSAVMGFDKGRADGHQMAQMKDQVVEAMHQGAIGLSTGLIYPPGSFTSTEELIELTKIVGDRHGFYFRVSGFPPAGRIRGR